MSQSRRRPPPRRFDRVGGPAAAPLPVPIPILPNPALPGGAVQMPSLPDFSGAIRAFATTWGAEVQVALGFGIVALGAFVLAFSVPKVRGAAKLGASFTPAGRVLSLL